MKTGPARTLLPGILGEIAEVAGKDAAYAVMRARGGTRVDIPAKARADHWLTEILGDELADRICKHFAVQDADGRVKGVRHEVIPLGPTSLQKTARARVAKALLDGSDVRSAARAGGVHERTAWRVKKKIRGRKSDDQGELF